MGIWQDIRDAFRKGFEQGREKEVVADWNWGVSADSVPLLRAIFEEGFKTIEIAAVVLERNGQPQGVIFYAPEHGDCSGLFLCENVAADMAKVVDLQPNEELVAHLIEVDLGLAQNAPVIRLVQTEEE